MSFFQIRFHFISSIKQINSSKNFSSQMETVATKRNVTDVTEPFTDAETWKNHKIWSHYQFGGQLPAENKARNILKRRNFLKTFSKFDQHQDFYNFFDSEKLLDVFLSVFQLKFLPMENVEVQSTFSLINYEPAESEYLVETINKRSWITDVYDYSFNKYVKRGLKQDMLKRVSVNSLIGSSWRFKRFHCLAINVKK